MAGIKSLRKLQLGKEATAGTVVAATTIWRGLGTIEDTRIMIMPDEDVGYVSGIDRQYTSMQGASLSMAAVEATFEQSPHIFEAGIIKVQTGASDGSGSGKVYTYNFPTTQACDMSSATRAIRTYTIEGGDNQAAEEMEYAYVESFGVSGKASEALKIGAEWKGRQVSTSSFTTSATLPAVEEILVSKGTLAIDDVSGTLGATVKSNTLLSLDFKYKSGLSSVPTADGNLYFSFVKGVRPEAVLDLTFEHDGAATAEKANWRAGTARQIRLKFVGSAFTTAGTTYSNKTFIIDVAGKWEKFAALEDENGNDICKGTFRGAFDTTANLFGKIVVVPAITSIP